MVFPPDAVGTVYVGIGGISLLFFGSVHRYWEKPGSTGFGILVGAISLWSVSLGGAYVFDGTTEAIVAYSLQLLGAQLIAVGGFLLAVEFTNRRSLSARLYVPLAVYLIVFQALVWTNSIHELVFVVESVPHRAFLEVEYRRAFWVHVLFGYTLVVLSLGLFLSEFFRSVGARRRQSAILMLALLIPFVLNAGANFGILATSYDPTTVGFLASELLYAWALYGAGFLSVVPVARRTAIEAMDDAYVTVDGENVVVDFNGAAARILGIDAGAVGADVTDAFDEYPMLVSVLTDGADDLTEIAIEDGGDTYYFHLTVTALSETSSYDGSVLVMRDITSLKRREEQLRRREIELDLLRQVFTRVLRHNIRSSLCVVNGHGETIATEAEPPFDEMGAAIAAEGDHLEEISSKVTTIAQLVNEHELETRDLVACVRATIETIERQHPDSTVELTAPSSAPITASTGLEPAIRNLLENAAEHAGDEPRIDVDVRRQGAETVLRIADDGPGISRNEIGVLEEGRETALQHGSGIGLWLVDWVVTHSDGELAFDSAENGTTVTIRFRSATDEKAYSR